MAEEKRTGIFSRFFRGEKEAVTPERMAEKSWFGRLKAGLVRSSSALGSNLVALLTKRKLDEEMLEALEALLIQADFGGAMAAAVTERLARTRYGKDITEEEIKAALAAEIEGILAPVAVPLVLSPAHGPHVILTVGVNGSGKTTTIGKLAAKYRAEGHRVRLAAGDTFRAAAIEQLQIWGERTGTPVVAGAAGADPAGLIFEALREAKRQGDDILLIDTAGRLQNKDALMAELEKIVRVIKKIDQSAPHDVLLVLDATVGQNALSQVEVFQRAAGITGLVMTKLDGTARGGILVALAERFRLPVHFIGVGEGVDDLEPFTAEDFARALVGLEPMSSS